MAICFSIVFRRLCLFCVFGVLFCFGGPRRSCLGSGGGSLQRNPALVWTRSTLSVHRNRKQGKGCFFWMLGFRDFWAPGAPVARRWRCCKAWPYGFLLFVSTVAFLVFSVFVSASEGPGGALWEQPGPHLARKWGFCKAWPYGFLLCFMCFCLTRFRFFSLRRSSEELSGIWVILEAVDQKGGVLFVCPLVGARKIASRGSIGQLLDVSWTLLGQSWGSLGPYCRSLGQSSGFLGVSWSRLGGLLGCPGAISEASWAVLERREAEQAATPKPFKQLMEHRDFSVLGPCWDASWGSLGASWGALEPSWLLGSVPGRVRGHLEPSWGGL